LANGFLQQIVVKTTSTGKQMTDLIFSNGDKVGAGLYPPKGIEQGKFYNYEFDMNGNFKNLRKNSMFEGKAPEGASAASAASSAAPARAVGNSYDSRQDVISKQAAFNTSIAFVKLLAESDALPIAASVKAAKKADAIEAIVLDYASKFHKRSTGTALNFDDEALAAVGDLSEVDAATSWNE
jgi:hypothetical protein